MKIGQSLQMAMHNNGCPVCYQGAFPFAADSTPIDPESPDRYKTCPFCRTKVPFVIRRLKSYERRWDEENAKNMYTHVLYLQNLLKERGYQEADW